jgi:hypothetical protein
MSLVTQDVAILPPLDSSSPVTNGEANLLPGQGRTLQPTTPRHSQPRTARQTAGRRGQSQDATGQQPRGVQSRAPTPAYLPCRNVRRGCRPPATVLRPGAHRSAKPSSKARKGGAGRWRDLSPPHQVWESRRKLTILGIQRGHFRGNQSHPIFFSFCRRTTWRHHSCSLTIPSTARIAPACPCANEKDCMATTRVIRRFGDTSMADVGLMGGKNASLGEMCREIILTVPRADSHLAPGRRFYPTGCPLSSRGARAGGSPSDLLAALTR